MAFDKQKNTLYRNLGSEIVEVLKSSRAIIAGGAITSIFSENEVNDYDVYFRSYEDIEVFLRNVYNDSNLNKLELFHDIRPFTLICNNYTNRSILFRGNSETNCDLDIQLIHFKFFDNSEAIFDSFDFTINMGAFDFSTETFILNENFLPDVAARRIIFNHKTTYPIISTLRVQKYLQRNYKISKKEMFKIALAINKLDISTWEELEDQLSGFYGVEVSKLFDKTVEFSLDAAIDMLDLVQELPHEHTVNPAPLQEILDMLRKEHNVPAQTVFYKKVNIENGIISSPYRTNFKWQLGSINNGGTNGIWVCSSEEAAENYSVHSGNAVATIVLQEGSYSKVINNQIQLFGDLIMTSIRTIDDKNVDIGVAGSKGAPQEKGPIPPSPRGNNDDIPW